MRKRAMIARFGFLILAGIGFASCASLSSDQCARANWYQIGREDGLNGKTDDRLEDHRSACRKFAAPDAREYERGRQDGLRAYCASQDGYAAAKRGERFKHPCTGTIATDFDEGYYRGLLESEDPKKTMEERK